MKIICGLAAALFLYFTYLQFNDFSQYKNADWWSWVIFYVATAVLSLGVGWNILRSLPLLTGFVGFAFGSFIFRMQDDFGNFQFDRFINEDWFRDEQTAKMVQQTNEAGGLLLVSLWACFLAIVVWKRGKSPRSTKKASRK